MQNVEISIICTQEVEPHVASELCRLFPSDTKVNWSSILKNSKEAAKRVGPVKVNGPIGAPGGMAMGRGGGGGMRDRRDMMRGRPNNNNTSFRNTRPFDYGRYYNSGLLFQMGSAVSVVVNELCGLALTFLISFVPNSTSMSNPHTKIVTL